LLVGVLAAVAAALAVQGWRVTLRFVGPEAFRADSSRHAASHPAAPAARTDRGSGYLRLLPIGRYGLGDLEGGSSATLPPPVPRSFSGLHLTFSREWPQAPYEISSHPLEPGRAPQGPGSVRLVCEACAAVTSAFHRPPDTSPGEKLLIDAASFSVIKMMGNGRMTIVEWDPY